MSEIERREPGQLRKGNIRQKLSGTDRRRCRGGLGDGEVCLEEERIKGQGT